MKKTPAIFISVISFLLNGIVSAQEAQLPEVTQEVERIKALNKAGSIAESENLAISCAQSTGNGWCEYYAGRSLFGKSGGALENDKGLALIRSASAKSVPSADVIMSRLYDNGYLVEPKQGESLRLLIRAANNCHLFAQHLLGVKYLHGSSVKQDNVSAFYWLAIAAYYRHPGAKAAMGEPVKLLTERVFEATFQKAKDFVSERKCGLTPDRPLSLDFIDEAVLPNNSFKADP